MHGKQLTFTRRTGFRLRLYGPYKMTMLGESRVTVYPALRKQLVSSPCGATTTPGRPHEVVSWSTELLFPRRFRSCIDFLRPGERPLTHPRLSRDYTLFILSLENTPNRWWKPGRSLVSLVSDCHFSFVFLEIKNVEYREWGLEVRWNDRPQRARPTSLHP